MKKLIVIALLLLAVAPVFADTQAAEGLPFSYPAGILYRLMTSSGIGLLLMIRTIWNIVKDYNENHKASSVWSAVMKYLLVVGIIFLTLTAFEFMFGNNSSFQNAKQVLTGEVGI